MGHIFAQPWFLFRVELIVVYESDFSYVVPIRIESLELI